MLPLLAPADAQEIAKYADLYGRAWKVDPALILAVGYRESRWGTNTKHKGQDHGLMGLVVNSHTRPEFIGHEEELLEVETAIWEGAKALVSWRSFHRKRCKGDSHFWWSHYQWGIRVGNNESGIRVRRVYWRLRRKLRKARQRGTTSRDIGQGRQAGAAELR